VTATIRMGEVILVVNVAFDGPACDECCPSLTFDSAGARCNLFLYDWGPGGGAITEWQPLEHIPPQAPSRCSDCRALFGPADTTARVQRWEASLL
jgi:hypothetical protein